MYKVRKSWKAESTQLGAYRLLANAKKMVKDNPGYRVYDEHGKQVYPPVEIYASHEGDTVKLGEQHTTVWNQHKRHGDWKGELDKHGCGISCAAMAANLKGPLKHTTPEGLMEQAVKVLGRKKHGQLYAISTAGIVRVLKHEGVKAARYNVTAKNVGAVKKKIDKALKAGNPVICWTCARMDGDPFARGHHYVLAVGYTKGGKVLIANSGGRGPVQIVSLDTLCKYLHRGNTGKDRGWYTNTRDSAGIVIVG